MKIERFQMERMQCLYENEVRFNLSESGVWPLSIGELLREGPEREALNELRLGYPHAAGCKSLRRNISRFYGDDDPDKVTVTNGGSEANYMALWGLLGASDRVAFMQPNYLQGWGISRAYAGRADAYKLRMTRARNGDWHWHLDVDSLRKAVRKNTRIIVVTNPNNPTGHVLGEEEMQAIIDEARRVGAWILADEIYRGAEVSGPLTPSFHGRYDKVIVTSGLSKAFGLPGLRIGWIVSSAKMVSHLAQYHDYLTLTPNVLSDRLADIVMRPARRDEILERTRNIIAGNLPLLEKWIARYDDLFDYARPMAGAIATLRYRLPIGSVALFKRLLEEQSVLITPGGHMGLGRYLRIGYGYDADKLKQGLRRIGRVLEELRDRQAA